MESEALNTFFAHIASFATLPVHWPNVAINTAPADQHYRVAVLPVAPESIDVCSGVRRKWIVQVAIYIRDGVGSIKAAEFADLICAGLPDNTTLESANYTFRTTDACTVIPPLKSAGWYITPVQTRFITIN